VLHHGRSDIGHLTITLGKASGASVQPASDWARTGVLLGAHRSKRGPIAEALNARGIRWAPRSEQWLATSVRNVMARACCAEGGGSFDPAGLPGVQPFFEQKKPEASVGGGRCSPRCAPCRFLGCRSVAGSQPALWSVFGAADQIDGRLQKGLSNPKVPGWWPWAKTGKSNELSSDDGLRNLALARPQLRSRPHLASSA
jgi:hypothetical protein